MVDVVGDGQGAADERAVGVDQLGDDILECDLVVGDEEAPRAGGIADVEADLGVGAARRRRDEEVGAGEQRRAVRAEPDQPSPHLVGVGVDAGVVPDDQERAQVGAEATRAFWLCDPTVGT